MASQPNPQIQGVERPPKQVSEASGIGEGGRSLAPPRYCHSEQSEESRSGLAVYPSVASSFPLLLVRDAPRSTGSLSSEAAVSYRLRKT